MEFKFKNASLLKNKVKIIEAPTPVHRMQGLGGGALERLCVKREDLTAEEYGGNKVRNLEYMFHDALERGAKTLVTAAPVGSNFTAAISAHAAKFNFDLVVHDFSAPASRQIDQHFRFSQRSRVHHVMHSSKMGYYSAAEAYLSAAQRLKKGREHYWVPPGGSGPIGALGHVSAALELLEQVERGEISMPDYVIVGVGTCGTMAGLLAGFRLAGAPVKVIGVRCVDKIVCNKFAIRRLANQILEKFSSDQRISLGEISLFQPPIKTKYGRPVPGVDDLIERVKSHNGLTLDTTYTSKVFLFLESFYSRNLQPSDEVLFWNTFSPKAVVAASSQLVNPA